MYFEFEEAAERFETLVYLATHGEDIVLTQHGRPVARMLPFEGNSSYVFDMSVRRRRPAAGLSAAVLTALAAVAAAAWCRWRPVRRVVATPS